MTGFYITIYNGLLKDGHRKRIGLAVWEFMWLIDRVTSIDEDGTGTVLGGKAIKLTEIAGELGTAPSVTSENLTKLEQEKYIKTKNTGKGLVIKVNKAKKRFGKKDSSSEFGKTETSFRESRNQNSEKPKPLLYDITEDITVDKNVANGFLQKLPRAFEDKVYIKYIADLIEETTGDKKSRKAFELIAAKIPEAFIREALSEIKVDGARNRGAVLVDKVKKYAKRNI